MLIAFRVLMSFLSQHLMGISIIFYIYKFYYVEFYRKMWREYHMVSFFLYYYYYSEFSIFIYFLFILIDCLM